MVSWLWSQSVIIKGVLPSLYEGRSVCPVRLVCPLRAWSSLIGVDAVIPPLDSSRTLIVIMSDYLFCYDRAGLD